jgi:hypothetical protein
MVGARARRSERDLREDDDEDEREEDEQSARQDAQCNATQFGMTTSMST